MTTKPTPHEVIASHIAEALIVGQANQETTPEKAARVISALTAAGFSIVPTALVEEAVMLLGAVESPIDNSLAARLRECVHGGKP